MRYRRAIFVIAWGLVIAACTRAPGANTGAGPTTSSGSSPEVSPAPASLSIRDAGYRLAAPVERSAAVVWNRTVYIAGGLDARGASVGGVFSMNPDTGYLKSVGSMPFVFRDAAAALIDTASSH